MEYDIRITVIVDISLAAIDVTLGHTRILLGNLATLRGSLEIEEDRECGRKRRS